MKLIDKAMEILARTNDGNALSPGHLHLVETAVNGLLSDAGTEVFNTLYADVIRGSYTKPWLHGIEHLRRDHDGTITWKGIAIDHYAFRCPAEEREAATRLAARCRALEEKNFPVNGRTAIDDNLFPAAPADTPWLKAMLTHYTVFADASGIVKWLVLILGGGNAAALCVNDGKLETMYTMRSKFVPGCFLLLHALSEQGFTSCGERLHTYEGFVTAMEESGILPAHVDQVLATDLSTTATDARSQLTH